MSEITDHEAEQIERVNASGRRPVVFVHRLWLLPSSWDRWRKVFEAAGYATLAPGWPDDPNTVAEANAHPEVFAGEGLSDATVAIDPAPFRGVLPLLVRGGGRGAEVCGAVC